MVKRAKRNPLATGLAAGLWLVLIAAAGYGVWYHLRLQAERDRARAPLPDVRCGRSRSCSTEVAEEDLALEPRAELKRQALLEKALRFYEELLQVEPDDPELAWLAARAARRVGDIQRLLGRYPEALAAYDKAIERLTLATARRHRPGPRDRRTVTTSSARSTASGATRRPADGLPAGAGHSAAAARGRPGHPGYRQDLSRTHYNLGIVARQTGRPPAAITELDEAGRVLDGLPADDAVQRRHRARIALNLGPALRQQTSACPEAERGCREAIGLLDALVADYPDRLGLPVRAGGRPHQPGAGSRSRPATRPGPGRS